MIEKVDIGDMPTLDVTCQCGYLSAQFIFKYPETHCYVFCKEIENDSEGVTPNHISFEVGL